MDLILKKSGDGDLMALFGFNLACFGIANVVSWNGQGCYVLHVGLAWSILKIGCVLV